jgi:hypothetical protein
MAKKAKYVYVITKGSYSDYHICAVTGDEERAEVLRELFTTHYDDARVEKYTLDETSEAMDLYTVEFSEGILPEITIEEYDTGEVTPFILESPENVLVRVRAKDEKHAMKIAQDEYAKWKAEKAGIV